MISPVYNGASIEQFASRQLSARLGRLVFEIHRAQRKMDPDAVHDLRVSIRRFTQGLRIFSTLFPKKESRKIRRQLRQVMDLAGEIRNRDIALELLQELGLPPRSALGSAMESNRTAAEKQLQDSLRTCERRKYSARWRGALQLELL